MSDLDIAEMQKQIEEINPALIKNEKIAKLAEIIKDIQQDDKIRNYVDRVG